MTTDNRQIGNNSLGLINAAIGGLSTGLFALGICMQMAQQVFAAPAAHITADIVSRSSAPLVVRNAAQKGLIRRAEAASIERGAKVSIVNFAFTPAEITIRPGQSVTWSNDDGAPHGLKFNDGAKGTDLLLPAVTFSRRFDQPGTYDYSCAVHPYMTGRVVVTPQ